MVQRASAGGVTPGILVKLCSERTETLNKENF